MDDRVFIIAEIGMTHDGSLGQAKSLIKAASQCSVDAVKIQTHIADSETLQDAPSPSYFIDESRYSFFKRTQFDYYQLCELKDYSNHECNVEFISSPFSIESIELLEKVGINFYKVASGEVTNLPLLAELAKTRKPVLLSSGMSTWQELDDAVNTFCEHGNLKPTVLQCTSEYPCPAEHTGLNLLAEIADRYETKVGLSDHTSGTYIPIAAVCLGAQVIEKHFTLSHAMYGPDSKFSLEPNQMTEMINGIRSVEAALTNKVDKDAMTHELEHMKIIFEKSIVASGDILEGTVLENTHLSYKKPGDGIRANHFRSLIGKPVNRFIRKNEQIKWDDLLSS